MSYKSSSGRDVGKLLNVFKSSKTTLGQGIGGGGAVPSAPSFSATGGTITQYSDSGISYTVHVFNSSGTFEVASGVTTADILLVAGGAGGATGAGGAGGLIDIPGFPFVPGTFPISIGAGGGAGSNGNNTTFNGDSRFLTNLTAIGGGAGGYFGPDASPLNPGNPGGSGGGGAYRVNGSGVYQSPWPAGNGVQPSQSGASGTYGRGNPGASVPTVAAGGGGGGAGGAASGRNGGIGYTSLYSGSSLQYAGGGAGPGGTAGPGGGGSESSPATANTGGGGGSGSTSGGSGTIIIRYRV